MQLAYQLADSLSGFAYSFGGSCLILFVMNLIPGLGLRASEEAEVLGMDDAEIGEFAYDYVELMRDAIVGGEMMEEDESKYSSSPIEMHEKAFSSTTQEEDAKLHP
jgi:Amt family ammonium transporter